MPSHIAINDLDDRDAAMGLESYLRNTLHLTPAEARLALRLLHGDSLKDAAAGIGISYETARSTLKSVFQKTNVRRQVELVLTLARHAAEHPLERSTNSRPMKK